MAGIGAAGGRTVEGVAAAAVVEPGAAIVASMSAIS